MCHVHNQEIYIAQPNPPLVLLARDSARKEASGRGRVNGGATRKLVIIGLSFF